MMQSYLLFAFVACPNIFKVLGCVGRRKLERREELKAEERDKIVI